MRLTQHTDYALRVLMQAGLSNGRLIRISDIADTFGISRNHLTKIVHQLGARGYLETVQGRQGGIRLARPPASIVVGRVVRDFEEGFALVECFDRDRCACRIQPACVLKDALGEALESFLAVLDGVTLADLLAPRRTLHTLLTVPEAGRLMNETHGAPPA
ncbi:MAG: Rrf2 family transcriptional regulator [Gammaproteobacteria bacterium]|nr:Rrf2 family transcriptional regulator [Gammaproteobacteria bacterium]